MDQDLIDKIKRGQETASAQSLYELFHFNPQLDVFCNGNYRKGVRLFLFCHLDRRYPGLFLMKNPDNSIRYLPDGVTPWSLPALALSSKNLPFYEIDGHTPQGVYTMDGVMPEADQIYNFGRFKRIKLNFIDPEDRDDDQKLLPSICLKENWWREAVIAHNFGRKHLRIHGTGMRNYNPFSTHRTMVSSRGCITTREGCYFKRGLIKNWQDQKILLSEIRLSMGLGEGEEGQIKGMLYVVNIDSEYAPVKLEYLRQLLNIQS